MLSRFIGYPPRCRSSGLRVPPGASSLSWVWTSCLKLTVRVSYIDYHVSTLNPLLQAPRPTRQCVGYHRDTVRIDVVVDGVPPNGPTFHRGIIGVAEGGVIRHRSPGLQVWAFLGANFPFVYGVHVSLSSLQVLGCPPSFSQHRPRRTSPYPPLGFAPHPTIFPSPCLRNIHDARFK